MSIDISNLAILRRGDNLVRIEAGDLEYSAGGGEDRDNGMGPEPVSYTHLTLPTKA